MPLKNLPKLSIYFFTNKCLNNYQKIFMFQYIFGENLSSTSKIFL